MPEILRTDIDGPRECRADVQRGGGEAGEPLASGLPPAGHAPVAFGALLPGPPPSLNGRLQVPAKLLERVDRKRCGNLSSISDGALASSLKPPHEKVARTAINCRQSRIYAQSP